MKQTVSKIRLGLKDRQDVINKSLLRGMKNFFKREIKNNFKLKRMSNKKWDLVKFKESVDRYMQTLNISNLISSMEEGKDQYECIQNLTDIIGIFLCQTKYLKASRFWGRTVCKSIKTFIRLYNKCWKSYSHKLFNDIAKVKL